jgi:hypothetical protein
LRRRRIVQGPPEPCAQVRILPGAQKPEQRDHPAERRKCQTSRAGPSPAGSGSLPLRLADRECVASGSTGGGETGSAPLTGHRARAGLRGTAATPEGRPARTRAPLTPGPRPPPEASRHTSHPALRVAVRRLGTTYPVVPATRERGSDAAVHRAEEVRPGRRPPESGPRVSPRAALGSPPR